MDNINLTFGFKTAGKGQVGPRKLGGWSRQPPGPALTMGECQLKQDERKWDTAAW